VRLSHRERARRLAYIPQRTSLAFSFTVRQYVALGVYALGSQAREEDVQRAMERADIADRAEEPLPVLSAGQQQRATLARALVQLERRTAEGDLPPPLGLLADEPVSAMDPRHALHTMGLLRDLAAAGLTVAVVLHDLTLAARFCDRALLIDAGGHIAADGPTAEALDPGILAEVFEVDFERLRGDGGPVLVAGVSRT
jgi:iron complex transport system ATP-binding protein